MNFLRLTLFALVLFFVPAGWAEPPDEVIRTYGEPIETAGFASVADMLQPGESRKSQGMVAPIIEESFGTDEEKMFDLKDVVALKDPKRALKMSNTEYLNTFM